MILAQAAEAAADPFNWNALVALLTLLVVAWERWSANRREKAQAEDRKELKATKEIVEKSAGTLSDIHKETNSMKDALVTVTAKAARAEGKEEERTEERARGEKASVSTEPMPVTVVSSPDNPVVVQDISKPTSAPLPEPAAPVKVTVVSSTEEPVVVHDVSETKKKGKSP